MNAAKLSFGDFELDVAGYELSRYGRSIKVERIPMELLLLLVDRGGQLVTRDEILEKLWGKDVFLDVDNSINTAISKIRVVLKDDPEDPAFIRTVPGKGYRFIAPITVLPCGKNAAKIVFFQCENGYIAHPIPTPINRKRNSDHTMYFTRSIGRRRLRKPNAMEISSANSSMDWK